MSYSENLDPNPNVCTNTTAYVNTYDKCDVAYSNSGYGDHTNYKNWAWCGHTDYSDYHCTNTYVNYANKCETYANYSNSASYTRPNTGTPTSLYWNPAWWDNTAKNMTLTYLSGSAQMLKDIRTNISYLEKNKGQQTTLNTTEFSTTPVDSTLSQGVVVDNVIQDTLKDNIKRLYTAIGKGAITSTLPATSYELSTIKRADENSLRNQLDTLAAADLSAQYSNATNTTRYKVVDTYQVLYCCNHTYSNATYVASYPDAYTEEYTNGGYSNDVYANSCSHSPSGYTCSHSPSGYTCSDTPTGYYDACPHTVYTESYSNVYTAVYTDCGTKQDYTIGGYGWYDTYPDYTETYTNCQDTYNDIYKDSYVNNYADGGYSDSSYSDYNDKTYNDEVYKELNYTDYSNYGDVAYSNYGDGNPV